MNILVVDDNRDAAEMLAALFESRGHRVAMAHEPLGALAQTRDFHLDAAILDLDLPSMDGYELAEHLRVNGAKCRIVVVTGSPHRDVQRCAKLDIAGYLVKPVDFDALAAAIEGDRLPTARRGSAAR